ADIYQQMNSVIRQFKPDIVAIEKLFFARNAKTVMRVGQALGVMLLSAARAKAEIYEYAPKTIKKVLTGNGNADKKTVQKHVRKILGSKVRSRKKQKTHFDNSADALAVAICHVIKSEGG
ncbi:crossover junction endodeoxyribonuclease RuvC, partial [Patescibacteria group bacterium]|nr:crossover junction endodeoxyribonuclease RuvC [Patescibacteria group bacterium]